jgi:four helix bundle protein
MDAARTGDPLWSVQAYRLASYAIECHTFDRQTNRQFFRGTTVDQLTQAIGSIAANIAEGYSRPSLGDQNRFYGYALGSAREAIAWYDTLRIELGALADDRQTTLIQIRRLLLTMLRNSRSGDARAAMSNSTRRTPAEES